MTRHRRPNSTSGRPHVLDVIDDAWASSKLSDDEMDVERHEAAVAPLIEGEEGELDVDTVVVSTGHTTGSAVDSAMERRRREEGRWNDLALDVFDAVGAAASASAAAAAVEAYARPNSGANSSTPAGGATGATTPARGAAGR